MFFYISLSILPLPCNGHRKRCSLVVIIKEDHGKLLLPTPHPRGVHSIPFGVEGYSLIRANEDDRDYILECMMDTILSSVPREEKDLRDLWIDDILQVVSGNIDRGDGEVFKLVSEDGNAGMLWMGISRDQFTCDEIGYILGIQVRKDLRRRGLGKELVRSAEIWCRTNGLVSLSLNVGSANEAAGKLYEKMGYKCQSTVMRRVLK